VTLIFIGVFPLIARDVLLATEQIPRENLVKAMTLGATPLGVTYRIVMPQIIPRLVDTVRLALGGAWLFLIAAEAIASTEGLGYRIFLVRRYLAMDVILPYVAWITFLGFAMDWGLQALLRRRYGWYLANRS
jgi:NitT/TauT family transport system permease protein